MNKPECIIVHHTAVSYAKNADQYEATKRYHIGKGWGNIGYHYEISKAGKVYAGRAESEVGAHCKEKSLNYKSIGVCLDGNFDVELPTAEQVKSLKKLLMDICARYKIGYDKIYPHRLFATYKSCYGSKLSDKWASNIAKCQKVTNPNDLKELKEEYLVRVGKDIYSTLKKLTTPAELAGLKEDQLVRIGKSIYRKL